MWQLQKLIATYKKFSIGCYASPEEIEGFVFQHQAAVACQVQLL